MNMVYVIMCMYQISIAKNGIVNGKDIENIHVSLIHIYA